MSKATTVQVKTSELSGFLLNFALANAVSNEVTVYNDNKISANFNGKHYHKCFGATADIAAVLMDLAQSVFAISDDLRGGDLSNEQKSAIDSAIQSTAWILSGIDAYD